jgi:hypothetical protein
MRILWWICGNTRRDRVRNDDIRERLGVKSVEEKLVQHRLRWFGHIQRRPAEAAVRSGVIRRSSNEKRARGRPNLTWKKSVKRDLKDWCITKKLALDSREWNVTIHVLKPWSSVPSFLLSSIKVFSHPFLFFCLMFYYLFFFYQINFCFYHTSFFLFFLTLFYSCFFNACGFISSLSQFTWD